MNIKEFARKIGVSPTTISSALSGKGRVGQSTRDLIIRKAEEFGYTPNLNARRLVSGRSFLVALSHLDRKAASDLFTMQVARSIVSPLKSYGYDLMLDLAPDTMAEYNLLRQLVSSSTIDGTILLGDRDVPIELLNEIASYQHPCVVIGQSKIENIPSVGSVVINLQPGARQVAKYLFDQGHRRIGFIDSDLRDEVSVFFANELEKLGVNSGERYYVMAGRDAEEGAIAMHGLMAQPVPPTAVFARTDVLAVGALREARGMGLNVPGDLSIVGHDDLSLLSLIEPGLTTVRVNVDELSEYAASILNELLSDPDAHIAPEVSDTCLMVRHTTGPVKAGSWHVDC